MNATIKYFLSQAGQKASLLAGGNGKSEQVVTVGKENPLLGSAESVLRAISDRYQIATPDQWIALLEQAAIKSDGSVVLDLTVHRYDLEPYQESFDVVPTLAELLASIPARKARKAENETAKQREITEATLAVVQERRTVERSTYEDGERYTWLAPDWPYPVDETMKQSPDALAWVAELDAAKETAKSAAVAEAARKKAEKEARIRAESAAENERRAALGLRDGDSDYAIEDGAMTDVPVWESHSRGKNWMATVTVDPSKPGGLDRSFVAKAKGASYYLVPPLAVGEAVEFGGDYYSGSGRPSRTRWYGYVVRVDAERLVLHKCDTGKAAVKAGAAFAAEAKKTTETVES